jgi:hypothetical protein
VDAFLSQFRWCVSQRPKLSISMVQCRSQKALRCRFGATVPYTRVLAFADVHLIISIPGRKINCCPWREPKGKIYYSLLKVSCSIKFQFLGFPYLLAVHCIMDGALCFCVLFFSCPSHPIQHETMTRFTEKRWTRALC